MLLALPIVAALHWSADGQAPARDSATAEPEEARIWHNGNWGELEISTLVISPPLEMIPDDWGLPPGGIGSWHLPGVSAATAQEFLASTGLEPDQVEALMRTAAEDRDTKGTVLTPSKELVRGLPPDVRARLYLQLGKIESNVTQAQPFRFQGRSAGEWLNGSAMSPAARRIVDPLIYSHAGYLYFADKDALVSQITNRDELRRAAKALLRQKTTRLRVSVKALADVPRVAEYWGRGGRRTDIQPLLESLAGADRGEGIDVVHLLPAFVRANLYRYPRLKAEDLNRPELANCLWTALNFFNDPPDDRLLDPKVAIERLQRDYYLVHDDFELGDIVALLDERGRIFHVAVYIADDFVFTKNGYSAMAPWIILSLDDLQSYYRLEVEKPKLLFHRRKDL